MSADFWGVCPCCYEEDPHEAERLRSFREDSETGMDGNPIGDPNIRMIYKGVCQICGARAEMDTIIVVRRR